MIMKLLIHQLMDDYVLKVSKSQSLKSSSSFSKQTVSLDTPLKVSTTSYIGVGLCEEPDFSFGLIFLVPTYQKLVFFPQTL